MVRSANCEIGGRGAPFGQFGVAAPPLRQSDGVVRRPHSTCYAPISYAAPHSSTLPPGAGYLSSYPRPVDPCAGNWPETSPEAPAPTG